jgi:ATP-dependent DNA helicase RecG
MNEAELEAHLRTRYPKENGACEWKELKRLKHAVTGDKGKDIASYVSAIANMEGGHLILGVEDGTLCIVGIQDFHDYTADNICPRLAGFCAHLNSENCWAESYTTDDTRKTVWVLNIPRHQPRLPVYAHGKPWQRLNDRLVEMRPERLAAILSEPVELADWSAEIVGAATIADLAPPALEKAREKFAERNASKPWHADISTWNWLTLLDKAKLTANGRITRACLLLLGEANAAAHHLSPHPAQIMWKLDTDEQDYDRFGPPFILTTTELLRRVRNVRQKLFPTNQLLPVEIQKYETRSILEGMHNCIAHQDYERQERILVIEKADRLIFENAGSFFDGKAEDYFKGTRTARRYRNAWLAHAMAEINMIDTAGYGIHEMTKSQRSRYLPLPDYRQSTATHTVLEVLGRPIDEKYSQLLLERHDLDIDTVILLDRVQKQLPIADTAASRLRKEGLIEGRKPHLRVARSIDEPAVAGTSYARPRFEKERLEKLVIAHLGKAGGATRQEIDNLIAPFLPADLTDRQKNDRVKNLLSDMRRRGRIEPDKRGGRGAVWRALGDASI